MQIQRSFKSQAGDVTRKQLLNHSPNIAPAFEKYEGTTASELLRKIQKAPTSTPVTNAVRIGGIAGLLGGTLATVAGVSRAATVGGLGLAGAGLAAVAVGSLALWGGNRAEDALQSHNAKLQDDVIAAANDTASSLVTAKDGKIEDHRFFADGAFTNPVEIREEGSGRVLAREVTVNGYTLKEDAVKGEVSLNEFRFPGHLQLPTADHRVARLLHEKGGDNPELLQDTVIEFTEAGQPRVGVTSKRFWDDAGFGYVTQAYVSQVNEDGSAYVCGGFQPDWYALQPPPGLLNAPATGHSDRVTQAARRSDTLQLTYGASHGPLQGVEVQPVTLSELPIGATRNGTAIEVKEGHVEIRRGDQIRRFEGSLDAEGTLTVQTAAGEVRQDLATSNVNLTLAHPQGDFHVTQNGGSASVHQFGQHSRPAEATVTPEGNLQITWDGGTFNLDVPVPHSWM